MSLDQRKNLVQKMSKFLLKGFQLCVQTQLQILHLAHILTMLKINYVKKNVCKLYNLHDRF